MNKLKIYNDASLFDLDKNSNFKYPSVARIKNPKKVEYALDYDTLKYKEKYFTIKAEEDGVNVYIDIKGNGQAHQGYFCSYDSGKTWETVFAAGETYTQWTSNTLNTGDTLLLKGYDLKIDEYCDSDQAGNDGRGYPMNISTNYNKQFSVYGNIQSLHCGDNFIEELGTEIYYPGGTYEYKGLFYNVKGLISAKNLILQYPKLASYGYSYMFQGCTSLTKAPELPATALSSHCYDSMFLGCTSLATAPELPATALANSCYLSMFQGCTSLTKASELPATKLTWSCYSNMFNGCTSLATAPELPATELTSNCYSAMFYSCISLTEASELPATILQEGCYSYMFSECSLLTKAPELPATTLVSSCYNYMFRNCHKLNYIKAMFITTPSNAYTASWVSGVASTGTFVKNSSATWTTTGVNGIPSGWTVQTASS